MRATTIDRDERGVALVVAMLVLLLLTMLAVVMMAGVSVNRRVAGVDLLRRKALDNAEAGVAEAIMRIRNNDVGMVTSNPRATAQIYLANTGNIPVVGVDTVAMATAQPAGSWLAYSTATKTPNVLTITYKTDPARSVIYRYDTSQNPAIQTFTGSPIFEITATGTAGNAKRTVVTDVVATPITASVKGAMTAGMDVDYVGTADVCGHNHSASTPPGTTAPVACQAYETHSGDLPATWSTGTVSLGGSSSNTGTPNYVQNQTGFFGGPWDLLGMSQSQFQSFIGAPQVNPANINGLVYVDNDIIMGNQSAGAAFNGTTGEGLLYVDGDLTLNAGFQYTGLIYVEGDLKLNGHAWILGGLVVRGKTSIKVNGTEDLLYSSDAISQKIAQYAGQYTTLAWREK